MKFTKGPWKIVDRPSRGLQIEWGDDSEERPICHMRWIDGLTQSVVNRVQADAELIAMAPEMHDLILDLANLELPKTSTYPDGVYNPTRYIEDLQVQLLKIKSDATALVKRTL